MENNHKTAEPPGTAQRASDTPEGDGYSDNGHEANSDTDFASASLAEDIEALYEEGRIYAEAELAFQKSRAKFVAGHSGFGIAFILGALGALHLALIGLTVGAIIALVPAIGAWMSTGIVVGILLILAVLFVLLARSRFGRIGKAFGGDTDEQA